MDKRTQILTCARKLFLEQGFKSTSIQAIANEADISKGAVYLYFESKDDILLAIFRMLEQNVWHKLEQINTDDTLSPRDRFFQHILTFYHDVMENLQFNQMVLSESGMNFNSEFLSYAREYRYKLQHALENALLAIYGEDIQPWLSDLVVAINGIIQEIDVSIVLDSQSIDGEQLARNVCFMTDALAEGFLKNQPTPLFGKDAHKQRDAFLSQLAQDKQQQRLELLKNLNDAALEIEIDDVQQQTLTETLTLLADAMKHKDINKTLVQALLNNLKPFKPLKSLRIKLANELGILAR